MERVIVVPYAAKQGFFLVVEGNRRVASLKSLLRDDEEGVLSLTEKQRKDFSMVPCAVLQSTGAQLKHAERVIMGIRHIAGPKGWGAYQQALLVGELKDEEGLEFRDIGEKLGISATEAARRYRAIRALKHMEMDELYGRKAEPAFYKLFHELVSIQELRTRFGWSMEHNDFVDEDKAREFFQLIVDEGEADAKLKSKDDVRKLRSVVGNPKAEEALLNPDVPLSEAFRIGDQDRHENKVADLLVDARSSLAAIGFLQAQSLSAEDVALIDELMGLLRQLKATPDGVEIQRA
jgi:hypothetical protein